MRYIYEIWYSVLGIELNMAFGTFCRGYLILVKNDGENDSQFPVISDTCCIGRSIECDIRLRDINISDKHCLVKISTNKKVNVCIMV